jgi:LiaI-LiaF-like transmembrane region
MNCAVHAEAEAAGFCRNCGRALCAQCVRSVQGMLYCEDCLARTVAQPPPAAAGTGSPIIAALLGFIPGLGAVYNGEYTKAIVQVAVFAGLIMACSMTGADAYQVFFGLAIACFYLYMPIDSYRVAKAAHLAVQSAAYSVPVGAPMPGASAAVAPAAPQAPPGQPARGNWWIGPAVLVLLGVLFLLGNFGLLEGDWAKVFFPVLLILLGAWLIWRRLGGRSTGATP